MGERWGGDYFAGHFPEAKTLFSIQADYRN